MHGSEHCGRHQGCWPYHAGRSHQEPPSKTGKTIAKDLSRNGEEDLVQYAHILLVEFCLLNNHLAGISLDFSQSIQKEAAVVSEE